jgi:hypothetical protein
LARISNVYCLPDCPRLDDADLDPRASRLRDAGERLGLDPIAAEAMILFAALELGGSAVRPTTRNGWDDLVLPSAPLRQLQAVFSNIRHRDLVLHEWAYERTTGVRQGLSALFAGESGTGKRMAAGVLAPDLGLDVFAIDLATIVSKNAGETEQNLERILAPAAGANAILFFDATLATNLNRISTRHSSVASISLSTSHAGCRGTEADLARDDPSPDETLVAGDFDLHLLANRFGLSGVGAELLPQTPRSRRPLRNVRLRWNISAARSRRSWGR